MKQKHQRLLLVLASLGLVGAGAALVLTAVEDSLVYFYTPADLAERKIADDQLFRLGGLVEAGSVQQSGSTTTFRVTDLTRTVPVSFTGILPDLFREGQGVVAEGSLQPDGTFVASQVLAKHDETYMPKEVADALKKSGRWQDGATAQ
ncbi:MAG: cytochrome c maturation protein CcmE [Alphaproteobacteria bacterium]|nr:cytochrome c maturation protein CcmE [Alphaproteobacteria bacterium]